MAIFRSSAACFSLILSFMTVLAGRRSGLPQERMKKGYMLHYPSAKISAESTRVRKAILLLMIVLEMAWYPADSGIIILIQTSRLLQAVAYAMMKLVCIWKSIWILQA